MVLCKNCKTGALAARSLCNDGQGLFILPSFLPSVIPASVIAALRHPSLPSFPPLVIPALPSFPLSRECESIQPCHMTNSRWQGCMDSRSPTGVRDKLRGNDGLLSRIHYWFRRLIIGARQVASALNREWRLLRHAHHGNMQELRNLGPS